MVALPTSSLPSFLLADGRGLPRAERRYCRITVTR